MFQSVASVVLLLLATRNLGVGKYLDVHQGSPTDRILADPAGG